jgi:hypothetical protein
LVGYVDNQANLQQRKDPMPQRTNDFQRLVYLVRRNLAGDATVTESAMLTDKITGSKREVDVCIEGRVGGHPVMVCVECRDHQRVADVTWVDAMKAKHERLPTNALLLASRSGFTPEAEAASAAYGIQTFTLSEVESTDYPRLIGAQGMLWKKTMVLNIEHVKARIEQTDLYETEIVNLWIDNEMYAPNGKALVSAVVFVHSLLNAPGVPERLLSEGNEEHGHFEVCLDHPVNSSSQAFCLKKLPVGILRPIARICVSGRCAYEIAPFRLKRGKLGDIRLAWGKTDFQNMEALVVISDDAQGVEKASVHVSVQK